MHCQDFKELIEALAAGDLSPGPEASSHLGSCTQCAAELAAAQKLERLLSARETPEVPASFVASVMGRVRREKWRSERLIDVGFNVTVVVAFALVAVGLWMLLNLSGMAALTANSSQMLSAALGEVAQRVMPSLRMYVLSAAIITTALALWWWAERGFERGV